LFLRHQKPDGQLPCYVWANEIGYSQIQECVSFGSLCLEAIDQNPDDAALLADCYRGVSAWVGWLREKRMTLGTGLIEMFCGFDTGHDNSGRLYGIKYHGNYNRDGGICPPDDDALPILAPDMNANFYGNHMALAAMADRLGKPEEAAVWRQEAENIRKKMFELLWDEEDQFFYDADRNGVKRKVRSISITNVLSEGVLDYDLGNAVYERYLRNPAEFWTAYPFPAVSSGDPRWVQNLPGNSWGFYSQGLTALRTARWMPALGRTDDMEEIMRRWVSAWSGSTTTLFGQELHPLTGEPSKCSQWYSSCMLYFLRAIRRLYDI
ncbi:MAG: alpha-L-rhamnosidase, partial [Clostridia bacterium]|nr:alpha-L-rhamnosidase [Clostridia bacterium]